jgi:hypothetical protein
MVVEMADDGWHLKKLKLKGLLSKVKMAEVEWDIHR